jgi:hypothetical protein
MGESLSQEQPVIRPKLNNLTTTVLGLVLCFAIGVGGGTLYKLWARSTATPAETAATQPNQRAAAPDAATPTAAPFAASQAPAKTEPHQAAASAAPSVSSPTSTKAPDTPTRLAAVTPPAPVVQAAINPSAGASAKDDAPGVTPPAVNGATPSTTPGAPEAKRKIATAAKPNSDSPPKFAAAPASPRRAAATGSSASGAVRIQFGAFAIEENAKRTLWAVEATGTKAAIDHAPGPSGHLLYFVRSEPYGDRNAAQNAAAAVKEKAQHFSTPAAIDYVIVGDHGSAAPLQAAAQ